MCCAGAVVCAHTLHTVGAVAGDSSTNDGDNNNGDILAAKSLYAIYSFIYKVLCSISRTVL